MAADATGIRCTQDPLGRRSHTDRRYPATEFLPPPLKLRRALARSLRACFPIPGSGAGLDAASGERPSPREPDVFEDAVHRGRATGGAPCSSTETACTLRGHSRTLAQSTSRSLKAQRHVMKGEDFYYCGGDETGKPVAVDHEDNDWWLEAMRGVEPAMLVRLAGSSWSGHAAPTPELG